MKTYYFSFVIAVMAFLILSTTGTSQVIFDAHAGFSPSKQIGSQEVRISDLEGSANYAIKPVEQAAGYTVGLGLTKVYESGFFVQSELQYQYSKSTYQIREIQSLAEGFVPRRYNDADHAISVPVSVGVNLGNFRVLSGVDITGIVASSRGLEVYDLYEDESPNLYLGWHAGLGYDVGRVGFEVRYTQDFRNFGQGYSVDNKDLKFYGSRNKWTAVVRYYLNK